MKGKIGVFICECGPNIAEKVDVDKIVDEAAALPGVAFVAKHKLLCSEDGKKFLKEQIEEHGLTRLVIAACSPKAHESTFMKVCEEAKCNSHLFQMANIREHCAWIVENKEAATEKAIRYVKAAWRRVGYHEPLAKKEIAVNPDVLVIGGGITGIEASLLLAHADRKVYLIEKSDALGGKVNEFEKIFKNMENTADMLAGKISDVEKNSAIEVFTNSSIEEVVGFLGNFTVTVNKKGERTEIRTGTIVVATGYDSFDPLKAPKYGYGKVDNIYTGREFEVLNKSGKIVGKDGKTPQSVAIINCVGREEMGYCSGVCCLSSIKFARYIKEKLPETEVVNFYREMTLPDKGYQKFFEDTQEKGVNFIRVKSVTVDNSDKGPMITWQNDNGDEHRNVDMVILSAAMTAVNDAETIADMLKISRDETGFFLEEHQKLAPVSTATEGVFIAGCAQGPKNIKESLVQAGAVAGRILSLLIPGKKLEPEVRTSYISEAYCIGCRMCLEVCNYGAICFDALKHVSVVNEIICRGCGNCVGSCPSGAVQTKQFKDIQIHQEVVEVLR